MHEYRRTDHQQGQTVPRLDLLHTWTNHSIGHVSAPCRHTVPWHHYTVTVRGAPLPSELENLMVGHEAVEIPGISEHTSCGTAGRNSLWAAPSDAREAG